MVVMTAFKLDLQVFALCLLHRRRGGGAAPS
jgi:hypothetical protein